METKPPSARTVLPTGGTRLVMRASLLRRIVDTAQAIESEVAYLRLKSALDTVGTASNAKAATASNSDATD